MRRLGLFVLLMPAALFSQITFERTYGGGDADLGYSVIQTGDGGFVIVGETRSSGNGGSDVYMIRTDSFGGLQWERTFGDVNDDWGWSVTATSDGGYAIAGTIGLPQPLGNDVYLIKTDSAGNSQWTWAIGFNGDDQGSAVVQTTDGGYAVAGSTNSMGAGGYDVFLVKTDQSGNVQWTKTFGGSGNENGLSVQQTADGGFVVAGMTESYGAGSFDIYLVKTDASGSRQWHKWYGTSEWEEGWCVRKTTDGGYAVAGVASGDGCLVKTDSSGNQQWFKMLGGEWLDQLLSVQQTTDGGYVAAGMTESFGANAQDVYLTKTDASGNPQWQKVFGGSNDEWGFGVVQTADGGFAVAGCTEYYTRDRSDVYLIKTGDSGNVALEDVLREHARPLRQPVAWLACLPNPFGQRVFLRYGLPAESDVTLTFCSSTGQVLATLAGGRQKPGEHGLELDVRRMFPSGLQPGTYFCRLETSAGVSVRKMVKTD